MGLKWKNCGVLVTFTKTQIGATAIVVVVAAAAVWHFTGAEKSKRAQGAPIMVSVLTVTAADVPVYVNGIGTIQAYNTVTVRPRVDGELTAVKFSEGQDVKKGDVLAQIDSRSYEAALHAAQGNLARDEAALANARNDLKRYQGTAASGFSSRQRVETQEASVASLAAAVQSDQAVVENARVQLSYTTIAAPLDGRTGIRMVDVGNIVRASDAGGLVVVNQVQPISAVFTLPQDQLPQVADAKAKGPLSVTALSRDLDNEFDQGSLELIDNQIDAATGSVRLKVKFPNTHRKLWPGQFINVRLLVGTVHDGIALPAEAVQRGDNGPWVFVIKSDDTVEMRALTVSPEQGGRILVTKGLSVGERIVLDGQLRLKPGAKIKDDTKKASGDDTKKASGL